MTSRPKRVSGQDLKEAFDKAKQEAITRAEGMTTPELHRKYQEVSKAERATSDRDTVHKMFLTGWKHGLGRVLARRFGSEFADSRDPTVNEIVAGWKYLKLRRHFR